MKRKKFSASLGVGSSSLLMIFIVLCLVVFSVLSLVSANADHRLSQTLAERTRGYYDACNRTEETLSKIDAALMQSAQDASISPYSYESICSEKLMEFGFTPVGPDVLTDFIFTTELTEDLNLEVTLALQVPVQEGRPLYRITGWRTVTSGEWNADTELNLFKFSS